MGTWNVGGRPPNSSLNLEDFLQIEGLPDIYVLGYVPILSANFHMIDVSPARSMLHIFPTNYDGRRFQEIVPLNAGNVLGAEDNGPARKWVSLVRRTLNSMPGSGCGSGSGTLHTPSPAPNPVVEMDDDFEGSSRRDNPPFFHRRSFQAGLSRSLRMEGDILAPRLERRYSVNDRVMYGSRPSDYEANYHRWDDDNNDGESPSTVFSPMSYGYGNAPPYVEETNGTAAGHTR